MLLETDSVFLNEYFIISILADVAAKEAFTAITDCFKSVVELVSCVLKFVEIMLLMLGEERDEMELDKGLLGLSDD